MTTETARAPAAGPLQARRSVAMELARAVGHEALAYRQRAGQEELAVELKGVQDFVTAADRQAEKTIRETLGDAFADDGFVGEESGGRPAGDNGFWVVDPIDGTANYIRGLRHWSVSLAFVAEGRVQIGVVYDVTGDRIYSAVRGGGAECDGVPVRSSAVSDPERALAILGHSRRTSFADYQRVAAGLYDIGVDYRRIGSAALGLVRVAAGIADLYYERHLNAWDMLAGALIASESGADVYAPPLPRMLADGGPVLAAAPGMTGAFAFVLRDAGPDCVPM